MDTSETYIKMCEKAEEIQKQWNPADGDFCWHDAGGEEYLGNVEFPAMTAVVHIATGNAKSYWYNWLWLPHQDQLQEMVKDESSYPVSHQLLRVNEFYSTIDWWEGKDGDQGEITWEQLWLAFAMKEKYNKVWNGEKWE